MTSSGRHRRGVPRWSVLEYYSFMSGWRDIRVEWPRELGPSFREWSEVGYLFLWLWVSPTFVRKPSGSGSYRLDVTPGSLRRVGVWMWQVANYYHTGEKRFLWQRKTSLGSVFIVFLVPKDPPQHRGPVLRVTGERGTASRVSSPGKL